MTGILVIVLSFIFIVIRSHQRSLKQQATLHNLQLSHQQELLNTLVVSQEEERKRIGQDLHDDVGTALAHLRLVIELFKKDTGPEEHFATNCKNLIDKIVTDVRHISHNLSPPGIAIYGFFNTLEDLCDAIVKTGALKISVKNVAEQKIANLSQLQSISLYRIMEELLTNTIRHSGAAQVEILFSESGDLFVVSYRDNGRGTGAGSGAIPGMGLQNIRNRLEVIGAREDHSEDNLKGYHFCFVLPTG